MARIKRAVHAHKKRRTILKRAKGYYGAKSRSYTAAKEQVPALAAVHVPRPSQQESAKSVVSGSPASTRALA